MQRNLYTIIINLSNGFWALMLITMKKSLLVVWSVVAALAFVLNGCVKPVPPSLEVNPTEVSSVPAEGGDYTLQVTTNQPSWKVVSDSEWVTVSQKESEMVVSVFENFEQQPREAKLTVSCYDEAGVEALKLESISAKSR